MLCAERQLLLLDALTSSARSAQQCQELLSSLSQAQGDLARFSEYVAKLSDLARATPTQALRASLLDSKINMLSSALPSTVLKHYQAQEQQLQALLASFASRDLRQATAAAAIERFAPLSASSYFQFDYVRRFFAHISGVASIIGEANYLSVLDAAPGAIVARAIFARGNFEQASQLLSAMQIRVVSALASSVDFDPSPEALHFISKQGELVGAALAALLRRSSSDVEKYLRTAVNHSSQYPVLKRYLESKQSVLEEALKAPIDASLILAFLSFEDKVRSGTPALLTRLIEFYLERKLAAKALEISDMFLRCEPSAHILTALVNTAGDHANKHNYIRRFADKTRAVALIFELFTHWDAQTCLDMLYFARCHSVDQSNHAAAVNLHERTKLYIEMLAKSKRWPSWQDIHHSAESNPSVLIRAILDENLHQIARSLSKLVRVPDISLEIEESYLLNLLDVKQDNAAALGTLLRLGEDSVPVAHSLVEKVTRISVKLFLVQYLLKNQVRALFSPLFVFPLCSRVCSLQGSCYFC
jgi:hypothetical protein